MNRILPTAIALLASTSLALAQELPAGPPVAITMVTQLSPTIPQYTRVDIPMLREELPKRSGGRISVTLASWPERNLTGPELLRVLRAGQIDLGGIALPTVAGDAGELGRRARGERLDGEACAHGPRAYTHAPACERARADPSIGGTSAAVPLTGEE